MATTKFEHFVRFVLEGKKGEVLSAQQQPGALFRGESMQATDDCKNLNGGYGTRVLSVSVGGHTRYFNKLSRECRRLGSNLPTYDQDVPIAVQVEFLEDCTWCASIKGSAVADDETRTRLQAQNIMLAHIPPAPKGNMLSAEELMALADLPEKKVSPASLSQAELFALVYAGCEAEAIFTATGQPFRGVVQGFDDKGRIVLGAIDNLKRAWDEPDITWTVQRPVRNWYICKVEGAQVFDVRKVCGVWRAGGQYSACSRTLGHVGDHVAITDVKNVLHLVERWPAALDTAPATQRPVTEWKDDDKETAPVTVTLDSSFWVSFAAEHLLRFVCGLPPRCTTRSQSEELRLLERQLQRALHPKSTLEYKKQHQRLKPKVLFRGELLVDTRGESLEEQHQRMQESCDVSMAAALLGHSLAKEPSLTELAASLLVLAGQLSHEFLSVKQARELNEEMRKLRVAMVMP